MFCKNCGKEMDEKAVICVSCGHAVEKKEKKKFYKKWWFWVIIVFGIIIVGANSGGNAPESGEKESTQNEATEITYEKVNLNDMFIALDGNAMQAEEKYQGKYVEFSGEIANFDSDGKYISVQSVGADAWSFDRIMCYIKNEEQKQLLLNKAVGDAVTIRGKIKSIGEVLGFSLDIDAVE